MNNLLTMFTERRDRIVALLAALHARNVPEESLALLQKEIDRDNAEIERLGAIQP